MSKSKCQMKDALRAVIDGVLDSEPGSIVRCFLFAGTARSYTTLGCRQLCRSGPCPGIKSGHFRELIHFSLFGVLATMVALAGGCTVGPDYQRPETAVPAQWSQGLQPAAGVSQATAEEKLARWWTVFGDPTLTSLAQRAAATNLDLKLAEARIRQARAAAAVAGADLGPTLDASGSYSRSHSRTTAGGQTTSTTSDQYQAGFDAGWEIDIFGGRRRNLEAARADFLAAEESRRDVLVSLMAEVVRDYIQLRGYQQQIAITLKNLAAQEHSTRLTRQRFEGGFVSGLDVANAEAQAATTAARIPLLESSARQTIYSLSILLGKPPAALEAELSSVGAIPDAPPEVPLGLPSDLLRRRPDIRQAEAGIHAATARIGVATADLFPRFTITGSVGYQSDDPGTFFDGSFWSLGPAALWHLFASGSLRAGVEVQKALQEQEVILYQQTVLGALQEVENALVASSKEHAHHQALVAAVAASHRAVDLADKLYTEGLTDFINVLQAQQSLFSTEDALVQSTAAVSTDLVALYKALGGGWAAAAPETAAVRTGVNQ
jgi:outer membrane protein, multidrug efflux system